MNKFVLTNAIVAALCGFLFGFDTAVISGAEQAIQQLWQLDDVTHGLAIAVALYGTVLGALFGGIPAKRYGGKITLLAVAVLYLTSALGSALAPDPVTFMLFRFIGGVGVGASSVAAPIYISEISPAAHRGRLVALFQFNIVLGILIAFVSNYALGPGLGLDWRWMLGVEAVPALAFLLMMFRVPESPRWLVLERGDETQAASILQRCGMDAEAEIQSIKAAAASHAAADKQRSFLQTYKLPILLAFCVAFFNQVSGINAIIYYAPRIFNMVGLGESSALLSSAGIGLFNLIFTMLGLLLIDKLGRRSLMAIGSVGLIVALGLVSYAFASESFSMVPVLLFGFIAFFAMSQGAVIWVFIAEIFPNKARAYGQSFGSFTHWFMAALITNVFPYFSNNFSGASIFGFFAVMMLLQLLFVLLIMPETKGRSLENIEMATVH